MGTPLTLAWLVPLVSLLCSTIPAATAQKVTCVRKGGNFDLGKIMLTNNSDPPGITSDEDGGDILMSRPLQQTDNQLSTNSVLLFVGETLECTIEPRDNLPTDTRSVSTYVVNITSLSVHQRSYDKQIRSLVAVPSPHITMHPEGQSPTTMSADSTLSISAEDRKCTTEKKCTTSLCTVGNACGLAKVKFTIPFLCAVQNKATDTLSRLKISVTFSVAVQEQDTKRTVMTEATPLTLQYYFGRPTSIDLQCPQYTFSWPAASIQPTANASQGSMVYCTITARDDLGQVVPDDRFGNEGSKGFNSVFSVVIEGRHCPGSSAPNYKCSVLPLNRGRIEVKDSGKVVAPEVKESENVMTPNGAVTQLAFEPVSYGEATITATLTYNSFKRSTSFKIGSGIPNARLGCEPLELDPNTGTRATCTIEPVIRGDTVPAFAGDFVLEGGSNHLTVGKVGKGSSRRFPDWAAEEDPSEIFTFALTPKPQPEYFDATKVTVNLYWNFTYLKPPLTGSAVCAQEEPGSYLVHLATAEITVKFKADPHITFTCNGVPCSMQQPGYITRHPDGSIDTMVINPVISGNGTATLDYQNDLARFPPSWEVSPALEYTEQPDLIRALTLTKLSSPAIRNVTFTYSNKAKVLLVVNHFSQPGLVSVPDSHLPQPGAVDVFCQDFSDPDTPTRLWLTQGDQILTEAVNSSTPKTVAEVAEIKFRFVATGSVLSNVGATAESGLEDSNPRYIVDGNSESFWRGKGPIYITLKEPGPVDQFTLTTGKHPEYDPVQWRLEGSADGRQYMVLHEQKVNYNTPLERFADIGWISVSGWKKVFGAASCGNCSGLGAVGQSPTVEDCKNKCQGFKGCNHINYYNVSRTNKTCVPLDCYQPPSQVDESTSTECHNFISKFKYFRFTPLRMREYPIKLWLENPSSKETALYKVKCNGMDGQGAVIASANEAEITVGGAVLPLTASASDREVDAMVVQVQMSSLDHLIFLVHRLRSLSSAANTKRVKVVQAVLQRAETLISASGGYLPVGYERASVLTTAVAELINIDISHQDPSVTTADRAALNKGLLRLLVSIADPTANVFVTSRTVSNLARSASIIADSVAAVTQVPFSRGMHSLAGGDIEDNANSVLQLLCNIGSVMLWKKPLGGCYSCPECEAHSINLASCYHTAYHLTNVTVAIPSTTSQLVFRKNLNDAQGHRVNLAWPLAVVGFGLPKRLRGYDGDSVLLRGNAAYFCVRVQSPEHSKRVLLGVKNTQTMVTVQTTGTASDTLGVAQRRGDAWDYSSCLHSPPAIAVNGAVTEECHNMVDGLPTEYAVVDSTVQGRCQPGDFKGCVSVINPDKDFNHCRCSQCRRTLVSKSDPPYGYYADPVAEGKYCVPYLNYTCSSVDYFVSIDEQCTGRSFNVGGKCVCQLGTVCFNGVCEKEQKCGSLATAAQCAASGLSFNQTSRTCTCPAGYYCRVAENETDTVCVEEVGCSSTRSVLPEDARACTNGSVYIENQGRCMCPVQYYCHESQCHEKARCDQPAFGGRRENCYPAYDNQEQLEVNASGTCTCPRNLNCDAASGLCACPDCLNGGECRWPSTLSEQLSHNHECWCKEGFSGPTCSEEEPTENYFVSIVFPKANFTAYQELTPLQKTQVVEAVRAGITEEIPHVLASQIAAVHVMQGSIKLIIEVRQLPSTWIRQTYASILEARVAVGVERKINAVLNHALGDLSDPISTNFTTRCNVDNGTKEAYRCDVVHPDTCDCAQCAEGYVHWESSPSKKYCNDSTPCTSDKDCNGRGVAKGYVKDRCECECEITFSGAHCNVDECLASDEAWQRPECGPARCAARADGRTAAGPHPHECYNDSDDELSGDSIAVITVVCVVFTLLVGVCIFWGFKYNCPWDRDAWVNDLDEDQDEEDDVQELAPRETSHSPTSQPTREDPTECTEHPSEHQLVLP